MPRDFHSSPVQSWYISVQRELRAQHAARRRLRRQPRRRPAAVRQLQPGARRTTPPGRSRWPDRRPIAGFADITYAFNGGKSRYKALQTKFEWRMSRDVTLLSSLTLSQTKDNGSQSLENANGNFPAPQDFHNLDADFGLSEYHQPYNSTTSFVWTLPFGSGRAGHRRVAVAGRADRRLAARRHQPHQRRRAGDADLHAGRDVRRSRASRRTSAAPTTTAPNVTCDPLRAGRARRRSPTGSTTTCVTAPTDPSQPFGNAGAQHRARPERSGSSISRAVEEASRSADRPQFEFRLEAFNLLNRTNFRAPNGNRSSGRVRDDHQRPTIRASCSSGSSCCGKARRRSYCC